MDEPGQTFANVMLVLIFIELRGIVRHQSLRQRFAQFKERSNLLPVYAPMQRASHGLNLKKHPAFAEMRRNDDLFKAHASAQGRTDLRSTGFGSTRTTGYPD
jgi:hypothetical protein